MASSRDETVTRLDRLEAAVVHMTDVLVLQSERMDGGFRALSARIDGVTERLDRLIAVTIEDRTRSIGRLLSIEERLERLEKHVGI
jgi:hypothetical protein